MGYGIAIMIRRLPRLPGLWTQSCYEIVMRYEIVKTQLLTSDEGGYLLGNGPKLSQIAVKKSLTECLV